MAFRLACTQFQQVVTLAKPVPRGLLCPLDAAILRVMRAHGDKNSIPMALLGTKLHQCEQLTAKDSGKASWTVYLKSRADCFAVEGVGNTTRARPLPILADHA